MASPNAAASPTAPVTTDPEKRDLDNEARDLDIEKHPDQHSAVETPAKRPLKQRILGVLWDSLDKTPEERAFIAQVDWWILT